MSDNPIMYTGVVPDDVNKNKVAFTDAEFVCIMRRLFPDFLGPNPKKSVFDDISDEEWLRFSELNEDEDIKSSSQQKEAIIKRMQYKYRTIDDLTVDEWIIISGAERSNLSKAE